MLEDNVNPDEGARNELSHEGPAPQPNSGGDDSPSDEPTPDGGTESHTSVSLLQRARGGNQRAWKELVQWCGPIVLRWCRNRGLSGPDADDVFISVFQSVHQHLGEFRRDGKQLTFRRWLNTITQHKIVDFFRQREQGRGGSDALQQMQQIAETISEPEDWTSEEKVALAHQAWKIIANEFPQWYADAFRRLIEGDKPADVAADLEVTEGAVNNAKYRVVKRLREAFAELIDFQG